MTTENKLFRLLQIFRPIGVFRTRDIVYGAWNIGHSDIHRNLNVKLVPDIINRMATNYE